MKFHLIMKISVSLFIYILPVVPGFKKEYPPVLVINKNV